MTQQARQARPDNMAACMVACSPHAATEQDAVICAAWKALAWLRMHAGSREAGNQNHPISWRIDARV